MPEGERVCPVCGCTEAVFETGRSISNSHEATDPHSFDNGLGSEPLQMIRELRFNSHLFRNTWQVVLGYYKQGLGNPLVEGCLRDLTIALNGATDEQFLQCRRFMLQEIRRITTSNGPKHSRKKIKQTVVRRTLEQAAQTWPRIGILLREREAVDNASG